MSKEDKQTFLTEEVINSGYSAETFIAFLESKKEEGSNVDNWTLEELQKLVKEFKSLGEYQTDEEIVPTRVQRIRTFGAGDGFRHNSSDSEDDEEEERKKDEEEAKFLDGEAWDKNEAEETNFDAPIYAEDITKEKEEIIKQEEEEEIVRKPIQKKKDTSELKTDKYYGKKEVIKLKKTELVRAQNVKIEVTTPQVVKTSMLKNNFTVFTVITQPLGWVVKRRYSDFEWLHKCLQKRFAAHYVSLN